MEDLKELKLILDEVQANLPALRVEFLQGRRKFSKTQQHQTNTKNDFNMNKMFEVQIIGVCIFWNCCYTAKSYLHRWYKW